jgi:hypothetical protein
LTRTPGPQSRSKASTIAGRLRPGKAQHLGRLLARRSRALMHRCGDFQQQLFSVFSRVRPLRPAATRAVPAIVQRPGAVWAGPISGRRAATRRLRAARRKTPQTVPRPPLTLARRLGMLARTQGRQRDGAIKVKLERLARVATPLRSVIGPISTLLGQSTPPCWVCRVVEAKLALLGRSHCKRHRSLLRHPFLYASMS